MDTPSPHFRPFFAALLIFLAAASTVVSGCDDEVVSPETVATAFLTDIHRGNPEDAMEALWPATRQELEAAYDDLEAQLGEPPPIERIDLLVVTRLESPMLIASIEVDDEMPEDLSDGDQISLTIEFRDDRSADLLMRWGSEEERWYVDLPIDERHSLDVLSDDVAEEEMPEDESPQDVGGESGESDSVQEEMIEDE